MPAKESLSTVKAVKVTLWAAVPAILLVIAWHQMSSSTSEPNYNIAKTVRYSFLVTNNTTEYIESAPLKVFAPVKQNSYQQALKVTANQPFETESDSSGNQSLLFTLESLAPHSSQVVNITAELRLASEPQPYAAGDSVYLSPEANIETGAPEVRALATKLSQSGDGIQKIALWLYQNIADIGYVTEDRGARYAITEKKGDCTEFASAFVALARASQVPSRMIGGFTLQNSGKLQANNYHNWAEFRQGEAWRIADPQNNVVDSGYGTYIAFYNFDKNSRLENSQRFLSYDQRLSVQML